MKNTMPQDETEIFKFGEFLLNVEEQNLTDMEGNNFQLSTKLTSLLLYMLNRPELLLRKKNLLKDVWPKVVVEENSLNKAVAALRKLLRDSATKSQYIETITGQGFRFVMPVIKVGEENRPFTLQQKIEYCQTPNGVSLAYSVMGEGYPLLLMPTWVGHLAAQFENPIFQNYLMELSSHYKLIRFDLRGFGMSHRDVPPSSIEDYVTDIEAVVNHLSLSKFALLGPSGGAMIATAYAIRHPQRVSHLAFLGGFIRGGRKTGTEYGNAQSDMIDAIIRTGWGKSNSQFNQVFYAMLLPDGTPEQFSRLDKDQHTACNAETAQDFFNLLSRIDLSNEARKLTVPCLICHGVNDKGVPFSEGQYAANIIPKAQLVSLPTKNHVLLYDEPAWPIFTKALHPFILGMLKKPIKF